MACVKGFNPNKEGGERFGWGWDDSFREHFRVVAASAQWLAMNVTRQHFIISQLKSYKIVRFLA